MTLDPVPVPDRFPLAAGYASTFTAALNELFAHVPLNPAEASGIDAVLEELNEISRQHPDELLLILLSGFLRYQQEHAGVRERQLAYSNASYAVDELSALFLSENPVGGLSRETPNSAVMFNSNTKRLLRKIADRMLLRRR